MKCYDVERTEMCKEKVCRSLRFGAGATFWRRLVVQASLVLVALATAVRAADLVIEIPAGGAEGVAGEGGGQYRLDYQPPEGTPPPNFTVPARANTITFQGLPGTKYHFMLYYSNASFSDLLTWKQTIVTAPDPPTDLAVTQVRNKQVAIGWAPPAMGDYTGFRFKVTGLGAAAGEGARNVTVEAGGGGGSGGTGSTGAEGGAGGWSHTLRDLSPGATYQLHAFTLLHDKESAAYASRNFTTKPNTPGKFIVWFRNETTLLVLWQPPYPPGAYTHYKVSIVPGDARESELYVEKEGEPPGPAQAAFKGLVPGRAYNISVQTVSEPEISAPTTAQYRTVPLRPRDVRVAFRNETAVRLAWTPPPHPSEFEKYQVSVSGGGSSSSSSSSSGGSSRRGAGAVVSREEAPMTEFGALEPGAHYTLTVKTMSGKVTSWPATADVTLKPLAVRQLTWRLLEGEGDVVELSWLPSENSHQDSYKIWYECCGGAREEGGIVSGSGGGTGTGGTGTGTEGGAVSARLEALLPGRNYTVRVAAVSRNVLSDDTVSWVVSRPLAPALRQLSALSASERALRLAWSSDVNSKQDHYEVEWRRVEPPVTADSADSTDSTGSADTVQRLTTSDTSCTLSSLFPGAVYEISVRAVSHGLRSDPHTVTKPTRPLPPEWMSVERVRSTSALVKWRIPPSSESLTGQVALKYRAGEGGWTRLPPLAPDHLEAEIVDMTPGEMYTIQLDTVSAAGGSERLESGAPLTATRTVRPAPVSNVADIAETRNITLEWPRPTSRHDNYTVWWMRSDLSDAATDIRLEPRAHNVTVAPGGVAPGAVAPGAVRVTLAPLHPGAPYTLLIQAHSYNLSSEPHTLHTRTRPLILSEMTIVTESEDADDNATLPAFLVVYTRTPMSATLFDTYRFVLESGESTAPPVSVRREVAADASPQRLEFPGLTPGALYNVTMWTLSGGVPSHPVQRQARLFPLAVLWLRATEITARSVTLSWGVARGVHTDWELQWADGTRLETRAANTPLLRAAPLRPITNYTFSVESRAGTPASLLTRSPARSISVTTLEAPPEILKEFQPVDTKPTEMTFSWSLPEEEHNGVLRRFVIQYRLTGDETSKELSLPPHVRRGTVSGLRAGAEYWFSAWAESGAGRGPAVEYTATTDIAAPPRPAASSLPTPRRATPSSLTVSFRADYFSPANGNVTAYTLLVGEEPRNTTGLARPPSWRDVRAQPAWPPYQVTEPYYPFTSSSVEEFTIGAERCEEGGRAYCNGPLKPGTKYYVKLRAFTAPDKFTDTAYTVLYTEVDNTAWYAGGGVCAVLLGIAGAGAVLARRRRTSSPRAAPPAAAPPRPARPVSVQDFLDHYRLMSADSDFRFSEEFEELKHVGREQPCTAADLPVNRPKNRFTNILPYDHSRYKLQPVDDEEGSDYINANYVPGHASPREFIVTQGPLHSTRDDFWRMCWESGTRAIVMLTRCIEKGREKCDRYWPYDTRPVYYGDIAVTTLNESRLPEWTLSELRVTRGAEARTLLHMHFTTWPDFGVPDPPTALVRLVRAFRERVGRDGRPVVVHCSAGVGRSGTFVTLDAMLQRLADNADTLDIFGFVWSLRRERVWMVQTEQQYICIHTCLAAVLEGRDLAAAPPLNNNHHNQAYEDDEGIAESGM